MTDPDYAFDIPITVRFHQDAIDQIIQSVEDGTYCALLGPRLCGKTVLLRFVEKQLMESYGWPCIYVDLREIETTTLQGFFADLTLQSASGIHQQTGFELPPPDPQLVTSSVFRGYLMDSLDALQRDLVLIVDNLDAIPTDLVQALLTSLRAAFMDQQTLDFRVTVVVSGALSLATLTVGESSPFRGIARRVFIGDLSEGQSRELIAEYLGAEGIGITRQAHDRLLTATSGDAYLIRRLCRRCVDAVQSLPNPRLGTKTVNRVTSAFLRNDVYQYAPLLEAVRLIEENPDLLRCILVLLENDTTSKADLPLPLSPDLDPLYLTGVVEQVDGTRYRLQNTIYRQFLTEYFRPGRVGHMLSLAGLWDEALEYLEAGVISGDPQSRIDLLPATIQSMYAADGLNQAARFLARGLLAGFGAHEIQIWFALPGENRLRLICNAGEMADPTLWSNPELPFTADSLEARAFRQTAVLRGGESQQIIQRAIPLVISANHPVGVVMVKDDLISEHESGPRDRELQLMGFLNQAGRALHTVSTRRQELILAGRMQASLLPESPPEIPGWQISSIWRPARETSGDFYDFIEFSDGRIGIVLADVTDKGMGAALYMALSRTLLRTYAMDHQDHPERVLLEANQRMLADTHGGLFIPLFYGLLDPNTGILKYCNGGHHPPYLLHAHQGIEKAEALSRTGIPLGVSPDASWNRGSVEINSADLLLLYTDGVVDAHNPEEESFGIQRTLKIAKSLQTRSPRDVQDAIISALRAFTQHEQQFDDLTLVLIKRE